MALPLQLKQLTRKFGPRTAVNSVDLEVGPGELVGLVGPNGSGKTTLLKMVAGFLRPTSGRARVFGLDPFRAQAQVMERVRFAFAPPALFAQLTAREHLVHLAAIHSRGAEPVTTSAIDEALDLVGLRERENDRVSAFSFGMRQRLALAQALLPRPELLVLDEPTDGLDPLAILELRAVLQRLRDEHGTAILLSSHLLIEIETLVDRLLVLADGRPLFCGPPGELTAEGRALHLQVSDAQAAIDALTQQGIVGRITQSGTRPGDPEAVAVPSGALTLDEANALLQASGVTLASFHEHQPTLEEALLARLREEAR